MENTSKAFEEFVMERCEKILKNDDEHQSLNWQIIVKEKELYNSLNNHDIDLLQQIDMLKERQIANDYCKIYVTGFNDRISSV